MASNNAKRERQDSARTGSGLQSSRVDRGEKARAWSAGVGGDGTVSALRC